MALSTAAAGCFFPIFLLAIIMCCLNILLLKWFCFARACCVLRLRLNSVRNECLPHSFFFHHSCLCFLLYLPFFIQFFAVFFPPIPFIALLACFFFALSLTVSFVLDFYVGVEIYKFSFLNQISTSINFARLANVA